MRCARCDRLRHLALSERDFPPFKSIAVTKQQQAVLDDTEQLAERQGQPQADSEELAELAAEHAAYMRGEATTESHEALMARGRSLEEAREFSQAIDAYLQVTAERTKNHDTLEEVWENAVKLAMNHVPDPG